MKKTNTFAVLLLTVLILLLTGCGDSSEMTLSSLESEDPSMEREDPAYPDGGIISSEVCETSGDGTGEAQDSVIFVYICGCVENPGVYELPAGSRVCDGLDAAGGFSEGADESRINLAGILKDGDMVYFPEVGENLPDGASDYIPENAGSTGAAQSLVNINTAGEDILCTLPGIGSSKAQAIIRYREEHGSFTDIKDIMNVNGIGENLFKQIEDLICV